MEHEIIEHYNRYDESERLKHDIGPLELARTQELIQRWLPPAPATILDVGGAAGVYSFWLAGLGYRVYLIDLSQRHIEQACQASRLPGAAQLAGMQVGDARRLDYGASFADVVIMHGPLYHLPAREDRLMALEEARRVLRPGGVLLAFAITRYAGLIYGLRKGYVFDPAYWKMIQQEVKTGQRKDPPDWLLTFPSAYFHLPGELQAEVEEAGLACQSVLGVLGPAWMVPDLDASWQDETQREIMLAIARLTENEPALGPRLMAVGTREPADVITSG